MRSDFKIVDRKPRRQGPAMLVVRITFKSRQREIHFAPDKPRSRKRGILVYRTTQGAVILVKAKAPIARDGVRYPCVYIPQRK